MGAICINEIKITALERTTVDATYVGERYGGWGGGGGSAIFNWPN